MLLRRLLWPSGQSRTPQVMSKSAMGAGCQADGPLCCLLTVCFPGSEGSWWYSADYDHPTEATGRGPRDHRGPRGGVRLVPRRPDSWPGPQATPLSPVRDSDLMRDVRIWRAGDVFPASARSNSNFMLTKTDCLWPVKETFVCQLTYNEIMKGKGVLTRRKYPSK